MEKLNLHSPDFTQANIEKMAELFPNCVTETRAADGTLKKAIDFDLLKQELSTSIVEGPQERYQLNWPGKREALLTANAPIAKTLRPCREESVDFDTTQNLYIEGDNLDALKLLQETYLGKVKMIYIDPPYNTGSDFIYRDEFNIEKNLFEIQSGVKDEEGYRLIDQDPLSQNSEANGRFHSDWLSMMYPRLKLARNLLNDEGVIAVQIDDNEFHNTRKILDEIFGEGNFVSCVIVKMSNLTGMKMAHISKKIPKIKEFIFFYAKNRESIILNKVLIPCKWDEAFDRYSRVIENINSPVEAWSFKPLQHFLKSIAEKDHDSWLIDNANRIFRTATNDSVVDKRKDGIFREFETPTGMKKISLNNEAVLFASDRLSEIDGKKTPANTIGDIWNDIAPNNLHNEGGVPLENGKKPIKLILRIIKLLESDFNKDDIILDFFSGSATSAHAVMELNAEDGGKRKFIMVQLPEACDEKSEDFNYNTIAEIGKERIRRAGKKIRAENADKPGIQQLDIGFRVLKVDSSNMKDVYYTPDKLKQGDLEQFTDNILGDRTPEDLLFQVLLDWGVDLTLPITQETIAGFTVLFVDDNALAACFDTNINEDFVKELAARHPMRVVFRDAGFASDSVKINIEQIFKLISPATEIKVI